MTIGMVCMGEAHVLVGVSVEKKGSGLVCEMDRRRDRQGGKQTGSYFYRHVTRVWVVTLLLVSYQVSVFCLYEVARSLVA